jgi:protein tyrosine phosphatase
VKDDKFSNLSQDFWRVVWEQDARVVVMLTAEAEGGQRKCHPYWLPDEYGPMKLVDLSEKRVSLESSPKLSPPRNTSLAVDSMERPGPGRRRATNPLDVAPLDTPTPSSAEVPHVIIRKMTLSHSAYPFQPLREITQLQYSGWPDFGAPAHPSQVLGLIEHCNAIVRSYAGIPGMNPTLPERQGERPIVVHCSAGCGRTGTFCTIDSVIDQLKRQRMAASKASRNGGSQEDMDVDEEEWMERDDIDLVSKTVEELRLQRLSMVQTLRQFVLCYETVLEWMVKEVPDRLKKESLRRSYHG